jgi:hypothetical protein
MPIIKNRPITGREYKIMLKTDKFKERQQGIADFKEMIKNQIELINSKGKLKPIYFEENTTHNINSNERLVWYLDTPDFQIEEHRFLLRIRKEIQVDDNDNEDTSNNDNKQYVIDLKSRNADRYISASYDLRTNHLIGKNQIDYEFEEDIVPTVENSNSIKKPEFASKFSHSVSFRKSKELDLVSFGDLLSIFPGLSVLNIDPNLELQRVNDFVAKEISVNIGKIKFVDKDKSTNDLRLNFWYPQKDDKDKKNPLIIEFSFDYKSKDKKNKSKGSSNEKILEEFRISLVRKINDFYLGLFKQKDFIDLKTSKTKTEFAYEWKQK